MSRRRPASPDPRQLDLGPAVTMPRPRVYLPGSLAHGPQMCGLLAQSIAATDKSRAQIAAHMSDLTHDTITEPMLNAWTAKSHDRHRFPLEYAAAFEVAVETTALQQFLADERGSKLLVGQEALDAELGRIRRQQADLRRQEQALAKLMRGLP
jgi:hypothetical protein